MLELKFVHIINTCSLSFLPVKRLLKPITMEATLLSLPNCDNSPTLGVVLVATQQPIPSHQDQVQYHTLCPISNHPWICCIAFSVPVNPVPPFLYPWLPVDMTSVRMCVKRKERKQTTSCTCTSVVGALATLHGCHFHSWGSITS